MSKTRKILSVVLAAALVFALAIPAFAVSSVNFESAADAATYTQEWSLAEPVLIEDGGLFPDHIGEYYIDVILKTNYPTGSVEFEVETTGDVVFEGAEMYDYYSYTNEEDEMCWNADINFNNNKVILVPDSSAADDAIVFTTADGEGYFIATIFVSGTNGTVAIKNDPKNATNTGGTLIAARLNPAKVTGTMIVGQTATVGAAVTIGEAAETKFYGIDTGVVDDENKYVYGVPAHTDVTDFGNYFKVENGSFTVTSCATGATLTVYDLEGGVFAEYTLIIFGDVNCDGNITASDVSAIMNITQHVQYSLAAMVAADVSGAADITTPYISALDMSAVMGYTQNVPATVNPYAN